MALNVYEGMFILDSNRYARDPEKVSGVVSKLVEQHDGELLVSRLWNEQKLAYPIKGHRKGTYWLTYFRVDSSQLDDINRQARLNDDILRSLVLTVDPRLVDALVAHASDTTSTSDDKKAVDAEATDAKEPAVVADVPADAPADAPAEETK